MSILKKNIIANYISQIYITFIGIFILPLYIRYMGSEAYGLIGFFSMLQAWFNLLDLGLSPTIARESARYYAGSLTTIKYRQLFRALSIIFFTISLVGGCSLYFCSNIIASKWLVIDKIDFSEVLFSLQLMSLIVALRWLTGLYRGVVTGAERLVWLSCFNCSIATLRFLGVFISMYLFGYSANVFFLHQFIVALLESVILLLMAYKILPSMNQLQSEIGWSIKPVKPILKFAIGVAFTSSIWVFVTQMDKLILSGILSLEEYGYFTLAALLASGIMMVSGPVSSAILPRMARLYAEGRNSEIVEIYRNSTQIVSVFAGSAALLIVFFAEPLLYSWTGKTDIAHQAAPVLKLYALGNMFLTVGAFPYYLQYAIGKIKLHVLGNLISALILVPLIILASTRYGAEGAGYAWLTTNALYFLFWVPFVHSKLVPGIHLSWLFKDCLLIHIPVVGIFIYFNEIFVLKGSRLEVFMSILALGISGVILAFLSSSFCRKMLIK